MLGPLRTELEFGMTTSPIYLSEADVGRLVTVKDAIAALEALFATWGQPSTTNLPRQRAPLAGAAFNLMGAAYGAKGLHGLKAYTGVKGGEFHTLLHSSLDGRLMAMIEADLFAQMRTGAASGIATRLLANAGARTLGVIGTGKQSRTQIAAVRAVRPITRVNVFSRTAQQREAFARSMENELADHVEQAKIEAGEFRELVAAGKLAWSAIRELGELITGKASGRSSPSDLTLFKSLGIALEDVAFAELVYQRALAAGAGRLIPI